MYTSLLLASTVLSTTTLAQQMERHCFAQCSMVPNPAYPHANDVEGVVILSQRSEGEPLFMRIDMHGLPQTQSQYAFALNAYGWDEQDCASAHDPF